MSIKLMAQVYERELSGKLMPLMLVLADHADDAGRCWPSQPLIAWKLGCSDRTIKRGIADLVALGAIDRHADPGKANTYRIRLDRLPAKAPYVPPTRPFANDDEECIEALDDESAPVRVVTQIVTPDNLGLEDDDNLGLEDDDKSGQTGDILAQTGDIWGRDDTDTKNVTGDILGIDRGHSGSDRGHSGSDRGHSSVPLTTIEPSENHHEPPPRAREQIRSDASEGKAKTVLANRFDRFWAAYPRKTAKGAAEKAWDKIKPTDGLLDRMLVALSWQIESAQWRKQGGEFIPHPATWLNAKSWEDEPTIALRPTRQPGMTANGIML